jgi:Luciferase-like monooxygenase
MTRHFILSASIADPALGDPQWAAQALDMAEATGLDLLVLGRADAVPFDAQVIAAWAAARSSTVGIVATVPAKTSHPFHVARALSAVDFLCDGRSGWMPVAVDAPEGMAEDMVGAARSLWDGWDADALIIDKASGRYLDTTKVRASHYAGPFFRVAGPVNAMRPPQGHPLLVTDADAPVAVDGIDVALVREGQVLHAKRRLLKVSLESDTAVLAARFAGGEIDGVNVDLADTLAELPLMVSRFAALAGSRATGPLRQRLGLLLETRATEIA